MILHLSRRSVGAQALLSLAQLRALALRVGRAAAFPQRTVLELSVAFVGRRQSAEANEAYRRRSGATDVLTFTFHPPLGVRTPRSLHGEILLCSPVIRQRAHEAGHALRAETAMLFVHGLLHLLGYHHARATDFRRMYRLERRVLGELHR